ncbi:uncharacterized protein V6R79_000942 [Siganus canaliculatus]
MWFLIHCFLCCLENACELTTASTISDHSTAPPSTQLPTTTTTQTTPPSTTQRTAPPSTTQTTAQPSSTTQTTAPSSKTTQTTAPPSTTTQTTPPSTTTQTTPPSTTTQTTATPSTTTPTTTTQTPLSRSTIRLLQPTTTTAATTTATTTTTTTAAAAATALLTSRTAAADTQGNVSFSDGQRGSNITNTEWMTTCEILLTALVGFLIIIIGVLSFCLWKTKKRLNRRNLDVIYNCDAAMEDQPHLKSNTHTSVSPEGQLETTFLMQTQGSGTHPGESN